MLLQTGRETLLRMVTTPTRTHDPQPTHGLDTVQVRAVHTVVSARVTAW